MAPAALARTQANGKDERRRRRTFSKKERDEEADLTASLFGTTRPAAARSAPDFDEDDEGQSDSPSLVGTSSRSKRIRAEEEHLDDDQVSQSNPHPLAAR